MGCSSFSESRLVEPDAPDQVAARVEVQDKMDAMALRLLTLSGGTRCGTTTMTAKTNDWPVSADIILKGNTGRRNVKGTK